MDRNSVLELAATAIENDADEITLAETVDSWRAVREGMRRAAAVVRGMKA